MITNNHYTPPPHGSKRTAQSQCDRMRRTSAPSRVTALTRVRFGILGVAGVFPLEDIVHIDPDHFKRVMPEWPGYVKIDSENAGV